MISQLHIQEINREKVAQQRNRNVKFLTSQAWPVKFRLDLTLIEKYN